MVTGAATWVNEPTRGRRPAGERYGPFQYKSACSSSESREVCVVRRFPAIFLLTAGLLFAAFAVLGAGPNQAERPPQPFFQDFFSGAVLLQGSPPPEVTLLIACIDGCDNGFESAPYALRADGTFDQLEVKPGSEDLVANRRA